MIEYFGADNIGQVLFYLLLIGTAFSFFTLEKFAHMFFVALFIICFAMINDSLTKTHEKLDRIIAIKEIK